MMLGKSLFPNEGLNLSPGSESAESLPLDNQVIPSNSSFKQNPKY